MAKDNSGCGALLLVLGLFYGLSQCSNDREASEPPAYERPAIIETADQPYAPSARPPPDYDFGSANQNLRSQPQQGAEPRVGLSNDNYYTNSQGDRVHSPAYSMDGSVPDGASARCRDGTYSFSQSRRGTCSHHGGVDAWY